VLQNGHVRQLLRDQLATALEHHSANQLLKAATNLNVVQPKLFQASRQDDLRFSDCTVSVIQILDDADAAFRILGAGLRTVLSVTTMFADKPHRLNGRTSAQRFRVLTILPPLPHSRLGYRAAGYRAAISCHGTVRHAEGTEKVCLSGKTGSGWPTSKTALLTHNGHQNFANKQLKASPYQCTQLTWYDGPQG